MVGNASLYIKSIKPPLLFLVHSEHWSVWEILSWLILVWKKNKKRNNAEQKCFLGGEEWFPNTSSCTKVNNIKRKYKSKLPLYILYSGPLGERLASQSSHSSTLSQGRCLWSRIESKLRFSGDPSTSHPPSDDSKTRKTVGTPPE